MPGYGHFTAYRVGMQVEANGRLAGDHGRIVERGMRGYVTAVPGQLSSMEPGAVAEVCIGGVTFDAAADMVRPVGPVSRAVAGRISRPARAESPREARKQGRRQARRMTVLRPDPNEPNSRAAYTHDEFLTFYGEREGAKVWRKAGVALKRSLAAQKSSRDSGETRADPYHPNGPQYTKTQFAKFYGAEQGAELWKEALYQPAVEHVHVTVRREPDAAVGWRRLRDGLTITGVSEGSPAHAAGVKSGWVIVQIDGQPVVSDDECCAAMGQVGNEFACVFERRLLLKDPRTYSIRRASASEKIGWVRPKGEMVVDSVVPGSPADEAGVRPGLCLRSIAGRYVQSDEDCTAALRDAGCDFKVVFTPVPRRRGRRQERVLCVQRETCQEKVGWVRPADSLLIDTVTEGSPADLAGIEPGWRIRAIDDTPVMAPHDLPTALQAAGASFQVKLAKGRSRSAKRPADMPADDDRADSWEGDSSAGGSDTDSDAGRSDHSDAPVELPTKTVPEEDFDQPADVQ